MSPQGSPGLPAWQFNALARIRARRRLAAAARPGEKKGVRDPAALQGIHQRAGDVLLTYEFMEILRTPFAGKNLILHREKGRAPGNLLHI